MKAYPRSLPALAVVITSGMPSQNVGNARRSALEAAGEDHVSRGSGAADGRSTRRLTKFLLFLSFASGRQTGAGAWAEREVCGARHGTGSVVGRGILTRPGRAGPNCANPQEVHRLLRNTFLSPALLGAVVIFLPAVAAAPAMPCPAQSA